MIGIYRITAPNGKIYIGQAKNIEHRWFNYRTKNRTNRSHPRLYPSFDTFGVENHNFEIVEECTIEMLNVRERYWQDFYDVCGINGLNCKLTKTHEKPQFEIEETIKRRSIAAIGNTKWVGRKHNPDTIEKIRVANTGKKRKNFIAKTEEVKEKMRHGKRPDFKKVICIETGVEYFSVAECRRCLNISRTVLQYHLKGNPTRPNGLTFKYV